MRPFEFDCGYRLYFFCAGKLLPSHCNIICGTIKQIASQYFLMALSTLKIYVYEPLIESRDFRLVTLHPGAEGDLISLALSHSSLDDSPAYEALSYVWGPQYPSQNVQCNDGRLEVGENLAAALRCLRQPTASRVLWIDRVAINQGDVKERTRQVGLMADIYTSAVNIAVWLGPADSFTERAFAFFDDISVQARSSGVDAIRYPSSEDSVWAAVKSILKRPWFSRAWTFQEIILARQANIYCGTHTVDWETFQTFLTCFKTNPSGPNIEDTRLIGNDKHPFDIIKARSMIRTPELFSEDTKEAFLSLFPLLDSMRTRSSTDPRDKVFALLNIACDVSGSGLEADYSKSHAEVYAMTAKWLLQRTKSLAFLNLVEKKDKPDLISWVPDFRYKDQLNFLHQPLQVWRGNENRIYNASGTTKTRADEEESVFQLTVKGIYVGAIVELTEPPGNMMNNVALGPRVLDGGEWEIFAQTCAVDGVYEPTGESIDLAYRRLRVWDLLPGETLVRSQREQQPTIQDFPKPGLVKYSAAEGHLSGPSQDIGMSILRGTTRKRLFKTDTGYMGLAHRSCQVGDQVYVLMGGDTPFILRPLGGTFFGFGGESYVHGLMDGEILGLTMGDARLLTRNSKEDLAWIDELGEEPWPFTTEILTLV